jgi:hypothetical protein
MTNQVARHLSSATRSALALALAVALPALGVACAPDASPDAAAADEESSALSGSVAVGSVLTVVQARPLRSAPSGDASRIRVLVIGELVVALESSPTNGFYHVRTVTDSLEGWVYGSRVEASSSGTDAGTSDPVTTDASAPPPPSGTVWHPGPGTTWQWQLTGTIDTSVNAQMYDIDLADASQSTIDTLHAAGRVVVCYFSAGSYEEWRSDAKSFPAAALGNTLDGWPDERWLDTRNATVRSIMATRLDLAKSKHCDAVEPDNVDGYTNNPGFPLTSATQIDYNKFLAAEAHARGLSIGLKNDLDQVTALQPYFDWALNEQCAQYKECGMLAPFVTAGKAVFQTEYSSSCPAATPGHSIILKKLDLNAYRVVCK